MSMKIEIDFVSYVFFFFFFSYLRKYCRGILFLLSHFLHILQNMLSILIRVLNRSTYLKRASYILWSTMLHIIIAKFIADYMPKFP